MATLKPDRAQSSTPMVIAPAPARFKGQTFARVDVNLHNNEKILGLSSDEFRLVVTSWTYCRQQLNNGHIGRAAAEALARQQGVPVDCIKGLVEKGCWHRNGSGYNVHDFGTWQETREEIAERRQKAIESGKKGADARWG